MKRILTLVLSLCLLLSVCSVVAVADAPASATVYVTIVTLEGSTQNVVMAHKPITVTDIDGDGALTMNDALYLAHAAAYPGGAVAGYASSMGAYGLQLDKLWGVANGGSYSMDLNDAGSNGIGDAVKDGDCVTAYIYAFGMCDTYAYFDKKTVSGAEGDTVELTLYANTYDMATWALVSSPVADADILIDGAETAYKTDASGKVTVTLGVAGEHIISAKKDGMGLVSPVCVANVASLSNVGQSDVTTPAPTTAPEEKGCGSVVSGAGVILSLLMAAFVTVHRRRDEI